MVFSKIQQSIGYCMYTLACNEYDRMVLSDLVPVYPNQTFQNRFLSKIISWCKINKNSKSMNRQVFRITIYNSGLLVFI